MAVCLQGEQLREWGVHGSSWITEDQFSTFSCTHGINKWLSFGDQFLFFVCWWLVIINVGVFRRNSKRSFLFSASETCTRYRIDLPTICKDLWHCRRCYFALVLVALMMMGWWSWMPQGEQSDILQLLLSHWSESKHMGWFNGVIVMECIFFTNTLCVARYLYFGSLFGWLLDGNG